MKHFVPFATVVAMCLTVSLAHAQKQQPKSTQPTVPANQRYCLEENLGGHVGGGSLPLLCRFETLEQCNASRNSGADRCMLNPYLGWTR